MKIAVLNYNGSAGKTTMAHYLLVPRMPNAKFYSIESINQSASDLGAKNVEQFKGKQAGDLIESLVLDDDAVVDIGASNIESLMEAMSRFAGSEAEFDLYLIPVTADQKSWEESLRTVEMLAEIGVPADNILLLPNKIKEDAEKEIPAVFTYVKRSKKAKIKPDTFVFESEIYTYLTARKLNFATLLDDTKDYRALAKAETDPEKRKEYARMVRWTMMARPVQTNLDEVFASIMDR